MGRYQTNDYQTSVRRIDTAKTEFKYIVENKKSMYEESYMTNKDRYDPVGYGKRVRTLREAMGCTQKEYAAKIGTTAATLSKIENGRSKSIKDDFVWLICAVSDTNPDYLLGISDSPKESKFVDSKGKERTASEPIHFTRPKIGEMVSKFELHYDQNRDLCDLFLKILTSKNPELRERVREALQGIYAQYRND